MFEACRCINILTGEYGVQIDTKLENLPDYEWVRIIEGYDGIEYIPDPTNPKKYSRKLPPIEELRISGLNYFKEKSDLYRQIKFPLQVTARELTVDAPETTINVETDLTLEQLNDWVITYLKVGDLKLARITKIIDDYNKEEDYIIYVTASEADRIRGILTSLIDNMTLLYSKISRKIRTASDELIQAVFSMSDENLNLFTDKIINDASIIVPMTDEEFDLYLQNLLQRING